MKKKRFLSVLLATAMLGSMVAAVPAAAADDDQTLTVWCWDPNFNIYAMQQALLMDAGSCHPYRQQKISLVNGQS